MQNVAQSSRSDGWDGLQLQLSLAIPTLVPHGVGQWVGNPVFPRRHNELDSCREPCWRGH